MNSYRSLRPVIAIMLYDRLRYYNTNFVYLPGRRFWYVANSMRPRSASAAADDHSDLFLTLGRFFPSRCCPCFDGVLMACSELPEEVLTQDFREVPQELPRGSPWQ